MSQLRVALLGSPRVERDGVLVTFDTRKATALLAYLVVTGQPQSRDTLADLLWPDQEQTQARAALRRTLSVLNSATGGTAVTADRSTVALRSDAAVQLDVADFREHAAARGHDHTVAASCARCIADLQSAEGLYRGDFMAGFALRDSPDFDDWQAVQAHGLRQQLSGVLERLVRAQVHAGELDDATNGARRWLAVDPLHEPAHAMLMRLYAWTGQRSSAMRQYRDCVRILQRELDVPPLSQTTALDEAVRSGRLDLPGPADGLPAATASPVFGTGVGRHVPGPPMVGRSRELALLEDARIAISVGGRLVVLSGEAGSGKSRLLAEFVSSATGSGSTVVTTRCHEGEEGLAYGVITDLLRRALRLNPSTFASLPAAWQAEMTRLIPELASGRGQPQPAALDSPGALSRFCDALVSTVSASMRQEQHASAVAGVLAVENVHWADDSSADVLAYMVRRLRDVPLLLVLTWRPESIPHVSPLRAALAASLRDGESATIDLDRLDEAAVATLVAAALPTPPPAATVRRLWEETGGLPLFVTEYLEAFRRDGSVPLGELWQLPGGVRDLLQARLVKLSEMTQQVLAAVAVLGSDLSPSLVRATSGRSEEEVVSALEEAVHLAVIVETDRGGDTYEFGYEAMRRLVYDRTTVARRRLLHSRAADALAQRRESVGAAATVAAHLRRAGRDAESAEWYWRAAEWARGLYAHSEALDHLSAAAALGHPGHLVHQATGDVLTTLGRYRDALNAYEQAVARCSVEDSLSLATLEHRLADVHHRLGAWDVADSHLTAALDLVAAGDNRVLHARLLADVALIAHRRGDVLAATSAGERALATAASVHDDATLAQAHDVLGVLATERSDFGLAEWHLRESLEHARRLVDPIYRVAALNNLALLWATDNQREKALAVAREALRLGLEHGDQHRAAALHTNLADLLHSAGKQTEALDHLTSAARLFAGVDDEELRRPEIWKLTRW